MARWDGTSVLVVPHDTKPEEPVVRDGSRRIEELWQMLTEDGSHKRS